MKNQRSFDAKRTDGKTAFVRMNRTGFDSI